MRDRTQRILNELIELSLGNSERLGPSVSYHIDDQFWYVGVWTPSSSVDGWEHFQATGTSIYAAALSVRDKIERRSA